MAAKPTDPSELLYQGQNVLGKATQVETPGQVSQPLTAGIASTPAAGGVTTDAGGAVDRSGGLSGAVSGAAGGGGEDGQSLEALIAQILGTAAKTADFAGKLTQPDTPGTRGGGSGTLSDQLRSTLGSSGGTVAGSGLDLGTRGATGGASLSDALRTFDPASGQLSLSLSPASGAFSPEALQMFQAAGISPESALSAFQGSGLENIDELAQTLGGLEQATAGSGAASAASGASGLSGLGTGAAGAGAVGALLSLLSSQLGNEDLGTAANALGLGTNALGIANTVSSLAPLLGSLGTTTAAVPTGVASGLGTGTAATGLASGASAGLGTAAGAAALPIAILSILDAIGPLVGKEGGLLGMGAAVGDILEPLMGSYYKFGPKLGKTLGEEQGALASLGNALPYVQSKQDLSDLLGLYTSRVGERVGGYGQGAEPFTIPSLPGAGGGSHEGGQVADFAEWQNQIQNGINHLLGVLPETGGGNANYLWNVMNTNAYNEAQRATGYNPEMAKFLSPADAAAYEALFPGQIDVGPVSSYWTQLTTPRPAAPPQAAPAPQETAQPAQAQVAQQAPPRPGAAGEQIDELIRRALETADTHQPGVARA